jgi:hypothetical protein
MTFFFLIYYRDQKYKWTVRGSREKNVPIKALDSISVLWRPWGDRQARFPLNPALFYWGCTVLEFPVSIRYTYVVCLRRIVSKLLLLSYSLCCVVFIFWTLLLLLFTACNSVAWVRMWLTIYVGGSCSQCSSQRECFVYLLLSYRTFNIVFTKTFTLDRHMQISF